jgi:glutamate dehydrogenase
MTVDFAGISDAYAAAYHGPRGARPALGEVIAAQRELAGQRSPGETLVGVQQAADGAGPALQIVTDQAGELLDSVTVLLHRLGIAYVSLMHPRFDVRRDAEGRLQELAPAAEDSGGAIAESWIHLQLHPAADPAALTEATRLLPLVVADARQVSRDSVELAGTLRRLAEEVDADDGARFPGAHRAEVSELLRWLGDGHFVVLGAQRCLIRGGQAAAVEESRLGVARLRAEALPELTDADTPIVLAQAVLPSFIRYGAYPYVVAVRESPDIEHRFVGLFTSAAANANVLEIPVIAGRVQRALEMSEHDPSRPGQLLLDVFQTIPLPELLTLDGEQLLDVASQVVDLGSRRRALLFLRADRFGHFVSCLVYLPRDRYTTAVRLAMQQILLSEFGGTSIDYAARVSESLWAVVHFTVRLPDSPLSPDVSEANRLRVQDLLTEAARTWADRLVAHGQAGALDAAVAAHYATALPEGYKQAVTPEEAVTDIALIETVAPDGLRLQLEPGDRPGEAFLTWYLGGSSASLSRLLPMLQCTGVEVVEQRPFTVIRPDGLEVWIYQFIIRQPPGAPFPAGAADWEDGARRFTDAVSAIWAGRAEADRFNELVLRAGLNWQQVTVLRAYAKYQRQAGFPYSQNYIETVLNDNPATARALVGLFEAMFDPDSAAKGRDAKAAAVAVAAGIDALTSLDTDRVLRAFATMVQATLRTNFFVSRPGSARSQGVLSVKLNPELITELPLPRPRFEIFVYSPRVEGVHLRFGPVARGGLRWSDRREDFRTEVLGLVKAQAVKNAVIVPVGAKGGFVVKEPPVATGDPDADREAAREEGVACYRLFIAGLLDLTDNVEAATGAVVPPPGVVRRDGDDAYLVVAADKGTATFSDIANEVAGCYGFWLGDAFASGGSVGYDHKAMGITAKGAWESVKRHFREMGVDTQTQDFTVVGIGDMSGDVFGNGMLLSPHIRLIAAFDHRHVFVDPDPDAARSFEERRRLFTLPRSSWEAYDANLISAGGGVFSRQQKSITVSEQMRRSLGIDPAVAELTPPELIRAILLAPADLLFNGGIGTYVKAEAESDAAVGDRANDAIRVNANQLRVTVIGEGGNLGVTPLGRVEFDLCGGRINTDALDNSAGVDCSDHEVNIKILVDALVGAGEVPRERRAELLASMTDEVSRLVLQDNSDQNDLMGTSRANAASLLSVHARQIRRLEEQRGLNRELEALPSDREIARRRDLGLGLTSPELATLMAHVKLALKDDVLATDLPDHGVFAARLPQYFPANLAERFPAEIRVHQLRREITATMLVNAVVDTGGISFVYRVTEDAGVGEVDAVRAFAAAEAIFGIGATWRAIRRAATDHRVPTAVSDRMTLDLRRLLDRAARWLVNHRPQPLAVGAEINRFGAAVAALTPQMPALLRGADADVVTAEAGEFTAAGVPAETAYAVASGLYRYSLLDVIDIADICEREPAEVADTYFALMDYLGTDTLLTAVSRLPRDNRWHSLARLSVRDDVYVSLRTLCFDVLATGEPGETGEEKIAEWERTNGSRVSRSRRTLEEIYGSDARDLATLSVAARQIRNMTRLTGTGAGG